MNVFELIAKIILDTTEYDKDLDKSEKKFQGFGDKLSSLGSGIGSGLATLGKAGAAAVGAASAAIGALAQQSIAGYAAQEQLVGGIETLYKDSASQMIQYANDAYKTAGLSANDYMNTAIESSAAMISSLDGDTKKAAEMTNMAIVDMSDNVNKMGTSMESLQNAYRGFSRGNFTMLDNLALGFAGTKQGMQQLLDKAEELSGVKYDISSYADIVQAIHVVQEEMDISGISAQEAARLVAEGVLTEEEAFEKMGTTAKESEKTISGSMAALGQAWSNLVVGFSNKNADIGHLIDNVVYSAEKAFGNLMPVIEQALSGISTFIEKVAPVIAEKLPGLVEQVLPPLLKAATSLLDGLVKALPAIIQVLIEQVPVVVGALIDTAIEMIPSFLQLGSQIVEAISNGLSGDSSSSLLERFQTLVDSALTFLREHLPEFLQRGADFVSNMVTGAIEQLPGLIEGFGTIANGALTFLFENMPQFLQKGAEILLNISQGIVDNLPAILNAVAKVLTDAVGYILDHLPEFLQTGIEILGSLVQGFLDNFPAIIAAIMEFAQTVIYEIGTHLDEFIQRGFELLGWILEGLLSKIPEIPDYILQVGQAIWNAFLDFDWFGLGVDIVMGIIKGIGSLGGAIWDAAGAVADKLMGSTEENLSIHSPSRKFAYYGRMVDEGLIQGIESEMADVERTIDSLNGLTDYNASATKGTGAGLGVGALLQEILALLRQIREEGIHNDVTLQGDAASIFRTVRRENGVFTKATGYSGI